MSDLPRSKDYMQLLNSARGYGRAPRRYPDVNLSVCDALQQEAPTCFKCRKPVDKWRVFHKDGCEVYRAECHGEVEEVAVPYRVKSLEKRLQSDMRSHRNQKVMKGLKKRKRCQNPKPLLKHRLYCGVNSSLYYELIVWRTKAEMRKGLPWATICQYTKGLCCPSRRYIFKKNTYRVTPCLGEIHLLKNFLAVGIIAHECAHAIINFAKIMKLDPFDEYVHNRGTHMANNCPEERFCYPLGDMVDKACELLREARLW